LAGVQSTVMSMSVCLSSHTPQVSMLSIMANVLQTKVGDQRDELSTAKLTLAPKFRVWVMVP